MEVKRAFARIVFCAGIVLAGGCASVTQGTEQSLKVETLNKEGVAITGAECQLSNDKGSFVIRSGATTLVRRSGGNLQVECQLDGYAPALGQAISRANAGLAGNVLLGGAIGAAIDVGTGAAYTYPTWLQLVFGEERLFDRSGNRNDGPVAGTIVRANLLAKETPSERANTVTQEVGEKKAQVAVTATAQAERVTAVSGQSDPPAVPVPTPIASSPDLALAGSTTPAAALGVRGTLRRGDALEYRLVDRLTGNSTAVVYRLDRIEGDRFVFNQGARIEDKSGQLVSSTSPIGGLFDSASPPRGWGQRDLKSGMRWREEYTSSTADRIRHELDVTVLGSTAVRIEGEEFKVTQIEYSGWIYAGAGVGSIASRLPIPFKATAFYSAELGRVVRFDAEFGRRSAFTQESLQLNRILR